MSEPLKRQSIVPRMDGIMRDVEKLKKLSAVPFDGFRSSDEDYFALSQFYLRQALEGMFHIGEHILSRLPGGRATEYKDIAKKLGEFNVVDNEFAALALTKMAGYRNRLTHFYAEITPEEMYQIINHNLDDFTIFLKAVKNVLEHPEKFELTVE
ncbi:MAG TPA: DUF86 domain-containing protein [Candidatus Paceibacterota bacterium]